MVKKENGGSGIIETIVLLIILGFLLGGSYFIIVKPALEQHSRMDDFCVSRGYEEMTDYNWRGRTSIKIECDEKDIFFAEESGRCIEWDKWDDCSKKEIKYCQGYNDC